MRQIHRGEWAMTVCVAGVVLAMGVAAGAARGQSAAEHYVVRDGESRAAIHLPETGGKATFMAARELQTYLHKMTGAHVPIDHGSMRGGAPAKITLEPELITADNPADGDESQFTIVQKNSRIRIQGQSDVAVLYGVYQYLENLGVRWYMPGEIGETVPRRSDIPIEPGTTQYTPEFRTRGISLSGYDTWYFPKDNRAQRMREYDKWILRKQCHFAHAIHSGIRSRFTFNDKPEQHHHHVRAAVLGGVSFEKQPERYALVDKDGKKQRIEKGQICFSDPRNEDAAVEAAVSAFKDDPHLLTYSLAHQDMGGFCICDDCVEMNGGISPERDPNRVVWTFINAVAKRVQQRAPGRNIGFFGTYGGMTQPPDDMTAASNVSAMTCHVNGNRTAFDDPDNPYARKYHEKIKAVKATGAQLASYEYTMFAGTPQPLAILETPRLYAELGYKQYQTEAMGWNEQRRIIAAVQAELLWNADQDPQKVLERFCDNYYGAAGDDVVKVMRLMDDNIRDLPRVVIGGFSTTQHTMTEDLIEQGKTILKQARKQVSGKTARRFERFAKTFNALVGEAQVLRAYYDALNDRSRSNWDAARKRMRAFKASWHDRGWGRVMSTRVLDGYLGRLDTRLDGYKVDIEPTPRNELKDANRERLVDAVFHYTGRPDGPINNLTLLPEVWRFRADVRRRGIDEGWHKPAYDDGHWVKLSTHNFYERQGFDLYDGVYWYRTTFDAPDFADGKRVYLQIGSLDDDGVIYVNGEKVHVRRHLEPKDWQRSFRVEVTDVIERGKQNTIAIKGMDGYGMGGLWNPCALYTN